MPGRCPRKGVLRPAACIFNGSQAAPAMGSADCARAGASRPEGPPDPVARASDLAARIDRAAFEIASGGDAAPDEKMRVSLTLLNAVSNLSMGTKPEQDRLFLEAEKMGVHIGRPHFYSPLPTVSELGDGLWDETSDAGIRWDDDGALGLLRKLSAFAGDFERTVESGAWDPANPAFTNYDSVIYYCMIRHLRPSRIVEVGAGHSTRLACLAASETGASVACVEPHPEGRLRGLDARLIERRVQDVDMAEFEQLRAGDVLFIDSSHVSKLGSDVNHLFFKVLPRLEAGVNVHLHDVFIPKTYPAEWARNLCTFWNEQYLLHAFLMCNSEWDVTLPVFRTLCLWPDLLEASCPSPTSREGGSFWMRKRGGRG